MVLAAASKACAVEIHKSANKTVTYVRLTHALAAEEKLRAKEEVATPEIALQCLNETHQDLAPIKGCERCTAGR